MNLNTFRTLMAWTSANNINISFHLNDWVVLEWGGNDYDYKMRYAGNVVALEEAIVTGNIEYLVTPDRVLDADGRIIFAQ